MSEIKAVGNALRSLFVFRLTQHKKIRKLILENLKSDREVQPEK